MRQLVSVVERLVQHDVLNFFLTNRIPRRLATQLMGWLSRIEDPRLCRLALPVWETFGGSLNLHEAQETSFRSIHDCFVRTLKPDARPVDRRDDVLVSPCDGLVGACGRIDDETLLQAKGRSYTLDDLLLDRTLAATYRNGVYVTLRLTSTMYHRFHAPGDGSLEGVTYVTGDVWNVNPPALRRVPRLYCLNERAVLPLQLTSGERLTLVPVAAILVASIHLHAVDVPGGLRAYGANPLPCRASYRKGEELGYFHHGSTIIVLASSRLALVEGIGEGVPIRMGEPLLRQATSDLAGSRPQG